MTKTEAILEIERVAQSNGEILSSVELSQRALALLNRMDSLVKRANEYNSLSAKRVSSTMKGKESPYQVIQSMNVSTVSEFLGEEFWMSLNSSSEKLVAVRIYNMIRERLTRGVV